VSSQEAARSAVTDTVPSGSRGSARALAVDEPVTLTTEVLAASGR